MGEADKTTYRVGSRKSELALIQTNFVIQKLEETYPAKCKFDLVTMDTIGDKILDKPLPKIGEKSLFTQELEKALEDGYIDFVVHSLKDLPTTLPVGKTIGAILKREDPRDCVILHEKHKGLSLKTLPEGCLIGTSSLRRTAQICHKFPQLKIESIRGNLNTRLRKLNDGLFDGIILALAGIERMNWSDKISEILDENDVMYAVGQGALAVECEESNEEILSLLAPLADRDTVLAVIAERSFLRKLEGGCSAPVAVSCSLKENAIMLTGLVCSLDGSEIIKETQECTLESGNGVDKINESGDCEEPRRKRSRPSWKTICGISSSLPVNARDMESAEKLGEELAASMIAKGASTIMAEARRGIAKDDAAS